MLYVNFAMVHYPNTSADQAENLMYVFTLPTLALVRPRVQADAFVPALADRAASQ